MNVAISSSLCENGRFNKFFINSKKIGEGAFGTVYSAKSILEAKYGKTIRDLFLIRLHPNAEESNYELIKLPDLSIEINDLMVERIEKITNK